MASKTLVLISVFLTMIGFNLGNFYVFDIPQALAEPFIKYFDVTTVEISLLYTVYSLPNFIFTPLGSVILGYTGLGYGAILFTGFVAFGLVFMNIGVYLKYFPIMVIGRTLFGIGGENAVIAQASIGEKWFSGSFLSVALALNNVVSLLANTMGNFFTPYLFAKERTFSVTLFVSAIITVVGWGLALIYYILETKYESMAEGEEADDNSKDDQSEENNVVIRFRIQDATQLPILFWAVSMAFALISNSYYNFIDFSTDCIENKFKYEYTEAKDFVSLVTLGVVFTLPFFSYVVLKVGRKGHFLLGSAVIACISFLFLAFIPNENGPGVFIGMIGISLFFSLYNSAIWSSIALTVPKQAVSFAYAAATTLQNIGLTVFPLLFGWINQERTGEAYQKSLIGLAIIAALGALVSVFIVINDLTTGGVLNYPENDKKVTEIRSRATESYKTSYLSSRDGGSSRISSKVQLKKLGDNKKGLLIKGD